jgi:hypothetical protein
MAAPAEVTMRVIVALLLTGVCACPLSVLAQGEKPDLPQGTPRFRAEDGGVSEMMESIVVSSKPQAPFTLTLDTEWVRPLGDGGSMTLINKRKIARDAAGRLYEERWVLMPKSLNLESLMTTIQIADPNAHTLYNCFFVGPKKNICELTGYAPSEPAVDTSEKDTNGELPENRGSFAHKFLGKQMISGVETVGVKDSTYYNPGVFGNDRQMTVEREAWYSPHLDLNLLSIRSDPRTGKQTFTATEVTMGDPDLALFELPAGFTVSDHRRNPTAKPTAN